jgi:hypothetical protein
VILVQTPLKSWIGYQIRYQRLFTLDAILVPDFDKQNSDNAILNPLPSEQHLVENCTFSTKELIYSAKQGLFTSEELVEAPSTEPPPIWNEENNGLSQHRRLIECCKNIR